MYPVNEVRTMPTIMTTSDDDEKDGEPDSMAPLLVRTNNAQEHIQSSTDSVLSNSDNCSIDIEMENFKKRNN